LNALTSNHLDLMGRLWPNHDEYVHLDKITYNLFLDVVIRLIDSNTQKENGLARIISFLAIKSCEETVKERGSYDAHYYLIEDLHKRVWDRMDGGNSKQFLVNLLKFECLTTDDDFGIFRDPDKHGKWGSTIETVLHSLEGVAIQHLTGNLQKHANGELAFAVLSEAHQHHKKRFDEACKNWRKRFGKGEDLLRILRGLKKARMGEHVVVQAIKELLKGDFEKTLITNYKAAAQLIRKSEGKLLENLKKNQNRDRYESGALEILDGNILYWKGLITKSQKRFEKIKQKMKSLGIAFPS